ncbi:MAG TPA: hypothetical protein VFV92_05170 [Candidatus Bathyarchaeia archaeon]|nr:hypothetical protein [Candidatus Bathyarchaeia archaeon]
MEFFRHCPECGRRFHVKLERREMTSIDRKPGPSMNHVREPRTDGVHGLHVPVTVHDERPVILDIEEFQYHYKCKHCGHEWTEHHHEEHREA